ncbi:hypothetical protein BCR44DRAFT_250075 [Catenaria anguillulae PL171]|uniref:tRNA-dihydrouridine(20a/20b) synthase [NAD(P)+] n=1 Tax=Catenaria anguillulae PL171 TaxID=765915 RepID=A0A1Y2H9G3_9FUNG|nr:hypothetical protein BCR44DRAFT_250075 [Catenaria anguillulae PL171]
MTMTATSPPLTSPGTLRPATDDTLQSYLHAETADDSWNHEWPEEEQDIFSRLTAGVLPPQPECPRTDIIKLFELKREQGDYAKVCAPMVRYSKVAFRELIRSYNVDICYTPMILANVFRASEFARNTEYTTLPTDTPVVLQLAASNADDFAEAAVIASRAIDAVDINCGCPQRWAYKEQIGSYLMERPDIIADMMATVRRRAPELTRTVKIRINPDLKDTVELARRAIAAGAQLITVHGRTRMQKSTEPVDYDAIKLIKESVDVPVVANGNIFTLQDSHDTVAKTGCDGVMAARGLLENPCLFAGHPVTPWEAAHKYLGLAISTGTHPFVAHHHLMFMLEKRLGAWERRRFHVCNSFPAMQEYFEEHFAEC